MVAYKDIDASTREAFRQLGDSTLDGYINKADYDKITADYGVAGTTSDLNLDGIVDLDDLMICGVNQGKDIWTEFNLEKTEPIDTFTTFLLIAVAVLAVGAGLIFLLLGRKRKKP